MLDPGTIRHLEALGVAEGWHCLEVSAGGRSIAEWLDRRVGSSGQVRVVDVDRPSLQTLDALETERRLDSVAADGLRDGGFDLVHTRWALSHLPQPRDVLQRLVDALKPGGWLLAEEPDFVAVRPAGREVAASPGPPSRDETDLSSLVTPAMDPYYGRRLYPDVRSLRLRDVGIEGRVCSPDAGSRRVETAALQPRETLVLAGPVTEREVADYLSVLNSCTAPFAAPITFAVWGRRP